MGGMGFLETDGCVMILNYSSEIRKPRTESISIPLQHVHGGKSAKTGYSTFIGNHLSICSMVTMRECQVVSLVPTVDGKLSHIMVL